VQHLVTRWRTNAKGGLPYYILDNEPSTLPVDAGSSNVPGPPTAPTNLRITSN